MEYRIWDKIMCKHSTSGLWSISPDGSVYYGNALWPEAEVELFTGHYDNTKWEELTESERERFVRHNNPSEWKGQKVYINDVVEAENIYLKKFIGAVFYGVYEQSKCGDNECSHYGLYVSEKGTSLKYDLSELELKIIGNIHEQDYDYDDNLCSGCEFEGNGCDIRPYNTCIDWVDGYLTAKNYEPNFKSLLGDE
jgi:hypothetical protein